MGEIENLYNKNVVIQLKSGAKKFGILLSVDSLFYHVRFVDNVIHHIPASSVDDVWLDQKVS